MKIETRNNGIKNCTVIIAENGKIFKRKNSEDELGDEVWLGYSYYLNGVKLDTPHLDTPDDFEEIDAPVEEIEENGD